MGLFCRRMLWLVPVLLGLWGLTLGTALAHEGREVDEYSLNIGWVDEPAYEGFMNGVELRVTKMAQPDVSEESGDHHDGDDSDSGDGMSMSMEGMSSGGHGDAVGLSGLQETLQVEVTHVASGASVVLDLYPDRLEAGRYTADLIPTALGVYEFRVFGTIEGAAVDQSFLSLGGGGGFDDIRSSVGLHFPEELSSARELESAVRGAVSLAEHAQDVAISALEGSQDDDGATIILLIVALALGALGLVSGAGGILFALRKR